MTRSEHSPLLDKALEWKTELAILLSMALQVSLATVARIALVSIDSAFLGHLPMGMESLAASALTVVWTSIPLNGVWSMASSLITLCGQAWGAKNYELTTIWLQYGLAITSVLSIPIFIYYWLVGYVLVYTTDDQIVIDLGERFARILSISIWPSLVYACLRQYFQSMGIMMPTTIVSALSIFVAIGANYFLIYGAFGWNGLGFDGSPLATGVASWFQPCALCCYCVLYKGYHRQNGGWPGWKLSVFTVKRFKVFFSIAFPLCGNTILMSFSNSLSSLIAAKLGSDVIAANSIISGLWGLLWALFWGVGCATQVRVANHLGASNAKSAKAISWIGFCCTSICVFVVALLTIIFNEKVFRIYTNDERLIEMCMEILPIFVAGYVVDSIEQLLSSILIAMKKVDCVFYVSTFCVYFIQLPIAYFGGITFGYGFKAIWFSNLVSEIVKLICYSYLFFNVNWENVALEAGESNKTSPRHDDKMKDIINASAGNTPTNYISTMPSSPFVPKRIYSFED